jgi:hypothetical protein
MLSLFQRHREITIVPKERLLQILSREKRPSFDPILKDISTLGLKLMTSTKAVAEAA